MSQFQSTTTPKDGCNPVAVWAVRPTYCSFNPQPPRRTAATGGRSSRCGRGVWFQSTTTPKDGCNPVADGEVEWRHEFQFATTTPKDGCNSHPDGSRQRRMVSIHNHPEGRLQRRTSATAAWRKLFQSTTTPKDGCNNVSSAGTARPRCFNPQPPRRTAATRRGPQCRLRRDVSIHNHPEGRLQRAHRQRDFDRFNSFNPQPPRRTAARPALKNGTRVKFQSTTTPKDGCNRR